MQQKKLMSFILGCVFCGVNLAAFAADTVAKEGTNPPSPAGALSADQIQPINNANLPKQPAPSATGPQMMAPATTNMAPSTTTMQPSGAPMQSGPAASQPNGAPMQTIAPAQIAPVQTAPVQTMPAPAAGSTPQTAPAPQAMPSAPQGQ